MFILTGFNGILSLVLSGKCVFIVLRTTDVLCIDGIAIFRLIGMFDIEMEVKSILFLNDDGDNDGIDIILFCILFVSIDGKSGKADISQSISSILILFKSHLILSNLGICKCSGIRISSTGITHGLDIEVLSGIDILDSSDC